MHRVALALQLLLRNWGSLRSTEANMSFALYIVGFIVVIIGLAWGAHLAHVPPHWIGVGAVVLVGLGLLKAVTHTRQRDPN